MFHVWKTLWKPWKSYDLSLVYHKTGKKDSVFQFYETFYAGMFQPGEMNVKFLWRKKCERFMLYKTTTKSGWTV